MSYQRRTQMVHRATTTRVGGMGGVCNTTQTSVCPCDLGSLLWHFYDPAFAQFRFANPLLFSALISVPQLAANL